ARSTRARRAARTGAGAGRTGVAGGDGRATGGAGRARAGGGWTDGDRAARRARRCSRRSSTPVLFGDDDVRVDVAPEAPSKNRNCEKIRVRGFHGRNDSRVLQKTRLGFREAPEPVQFHLFTFQSSSAVPFALGDVVRAGFMIAFVIASGGCPGRKDATARTAGSRDRGARAKAVAMAARDADASGDRTHAFSERRAEREALVELLEEAGT